MFRYLVFGTRDEGIAMDICFLVLKIVNTDYCVSSNENSLKLKPSGVWTVFWV